MNKPLTGSSKVINKQSVKGVLHVIAVASGKGGVGKSTTAMNLAVALAVMDKKVGLLDADVYGPSQPRMMGVKNAHPESNDGKIMEPVLSYGVKVMSMGFIVEEDTPVAWRSPLVQSSLIQMLHQVNWADEDDPLDILIIDMPPGTGDTQLSISQKVKLSGAVIVSTPQDIALIDARKGLEMFKKLGVSILGLVENMSMFNCPHCGKDTPIFSHGGAKETAKKLGYDFLAEIPLTLEIRENTDSGKPVVIQEPDGTGAKAYRTLAKNVWNKLSKTTKKHTSGVRVVIE